MASSLSNFVKNLAEVIHKTKCKYGHDNKTCEMCVIKCKDSECCLEDKNVEKNLIEYRYLCCKKITKKLLMKI